MKRGEVWWVNFDPSVSNLIFTEGGLTSKSTGRGEAAPLIYVVIAKMKIKSEAFNDTEMD